MVVEEMEGVVKLVVAVPPDNGLPPVELAYQSMVSPVVTAPLIETVPVPYLEPSVLVGLEGNALTVAVPVLTSTEVALVAEQTTFPVAPFEALLFNRI
jgi:hypothetical protein